VSFPLGSSDDVTGQVTVWPEAVQPDGDDDTNDNGPGSASVTDTPVPVDGPLLVAVSV